MTISIAKISSMPSGPFDAQGLAGIILTNGITTYFRFNGSNLDQITSFRWIPQDPGSILQEARDFHLYPDNTQAICSVRVINNYLDTTNRGGNLCFILDDGTTVRVPVITYGPLSMYPIWQAPNQGLITG